MPDKGKRYLGACHKTQQTHAICKGSNLQHVILITFCKRRAMLRLSDLIANMPRTNATERTRLQSPDLPNETRNLRSF